MSLPHPPLLVITDRRQARLPLETVAAAAFENGCRWLLLREKDLPPEARRDVLNRLTRLGRQFDATVMISADVETAKAAGVGVHLPRNGDVSAARGVLSDTALVGYSAHDLGEAEAAARAGADYVTLSPIFTTESKPGYGPALGLDGLRRIATNVSIPVVALGGVTADTAADCLGAGAAGVAVMGPVMRAEDPGEVVARFLSEVAAAPGGRGA